MSHRAQTFQCKLNKDEIKCVLYKGCIEDTYYLHSNLKVQMTSHFFRDGNLYNKARDKRWKTKRVIGPEMSLISPSCILISPSSLTQEDDHKPLKP